MLSYQTTGKVGVSAIRVILREAHAIERSWWRGGLGFDVDEADRPVELRGETPLFGRPGVSDEDDLYMAFSDALFILERLEAWASRFKIKWRLKMNGDNWGAIDPGGRAGPLVTQMDKWAGRAKVAWSGKGVWVIDEKRRAEILSRHAPS